MGTMFIKKDFHDTLEKIEKDGVVKKEDLIIIFQYIDNVQELMRRIRTRSIHVCDCETYVDEIYSDLTNVQFFRDLFYYDDKD
jgi:hypothetical protein